LNFEEKKKVDKKELQRIVFDLNIHVQKEEGSEAKRFVRRAPKSNLPNSVNREIKHRHLVKNRHKNKKK